MEILRYRHARARTRAVGMDIFQAIMHILSNKQLLVDKKGLMSVKNDKKYLGALQVRDIFQKALYQVVRHIPVAMRRLTTFNTSSLYEHSSKIYRPPGLPG